MSVMLMLILEVPTRKSAGRQFMIHNFQSLLTSEPNTMGSPYNETVPFWHFLKTGDFEAVQSLYQRFLVALKTANQYVVEHNVPLEYCTGSHNNAALLGGKEQSKSAIFYIAPYMGKEKASLAVVLTVAEQAHKDVKKYESRASDRYSRPKERLAKHFITKVVNRMNAYTELSDFQVAADLLNVPSVITSEVFAYMETWAAMNCREEIMHQILHHESSNKREERYLGFSR